MSSGKIDYTKIVNLAMHQVVMEALKVVVSHNGCNLLITFSTTDKRVVIPDDLKAKYPETMTIILNHQFSDLVVCDSGFSVNLVFAGVEKKLSISFASLIYFCDRDAQFSIEFKKSIGDDYYSQEVDKEDGSHKGKILYFDDFFKKSKVINNPKNEA